MKCIPFTDIGEVTIALADFRKLIWLKYSCPHCALMQWNVGVISSLPLDTMLENIMNYVQDVKEMNFSYSKEMNIRTQPFPYWMLIWQTTIVYGAHVVGSLSSLIVSMYI